MLDHRNLNALKVAIAACLSVYVGLAAHIPNPFWIGTVAILSLSVNAEASWQRSIERILGTLIGVGLALLVLHFLINNPIVLLILTFVIVFIAVLGFLSHSSTWLNIGISAYFVILLAISHPNQSSSMGIWRGVAILLGVVITLLVDHLLGGETACQQYHQLRQHCGQQLAQALLSISKRDTIEWLSLKKSIEQLKQLCLTYSSRFTPAERLRNLQLADKYEALYRMVADINQQFLQLNNVSYLSQIEHQDLIQHLANCFVQLDSNGPQRSENLNNCRRQLEQFATSISEKQRVISKQYWASLDNLILTLQEVDDLVSTRRIEINFFARSFKQHISYLLHQRPDWIIHAIKVAMASIIVIFIWLSTEWYGGICAGISVIAIGADDNFNKIKLKASLRFWGSVCGVAMSVLFVIFFIRDLYSLLLMVFVGSFYLGYLSGGSFKQMYFAWMAAMAYVITVVPNLTSELSIAFTLERAAGLLLGWIVIYWVMLLFWPAEQEKLKRKKTAQALHQIASFWELLAISPTLQSAILREQLMMKRQDLMSVRDVLTSFSPSSSEQIVSEIDEVITRLLHCLHYLLIHESAWFTLQFNEIFVKLCLQLAAVTNEFGDKHLKGQNLLHSQLSEQVCFQWQQQCDELNQQLEQHERSVIEDCYLSTIVFDLRHALIEPPKPQDISYVEK